MASSSIKGLTIEIGAETKKFTTAMKDIQTEAKNISKDLKTVDDTLKLNSQNAEAAASKLKLLQDAYKNAASKVEAIQTAIEKLNKEYKGHESTESYKKQLKELEAQLHSATLEQDLALEKVVAFKNAEDDAAEGTSRLSDIIKGNLISSAITGGLSVLVDLLKSAAQFAWEAVKSVGNFIGESIDLAKNMEETKSKVAAVFGEDGQKQIEQWASNAAHDFHTTQQAAMEAVSAFGNIMLNMGMATEEAQKYSEELVLVAAAQADFNNMETPEVLDKITSALAGNYKGLQSLGIVLKEADISERALLDTGKENADQLTDLEKKQAALEIIIEKSTFAVQKYNENTGSLVSMQAELKSKLTDVKTEIGERLYPVAEQIMNKIIEFTNTEEFSDLLDTIYDSVENIATEVGNFVNSGRLEEWISWLQGQLPTVGQKISEIGTQIADIVTKIWSAIDAAERFISTFTNRGGENLDSWLEQGRQYGGGGGWFLNNRASGGYVSAGQIYRINDDAGRRTEMFVPSVPGTILNGNQTDKIVNNSNSQNFSGGINIYVNSYGMNVAEVADELGAAFQNKIRMSGAML